MSEKKQTAKEWLKSKCLIDDGINGKDVSFDDALKALSMACAEERKNLLEKYAKLEEEAQLIGRQEAAKEIFAELEKIVPCGTCKGEHSCYCSIETQDESKHLPNCEIKDWCIDIESLKAKWVKEE